MEQALSNHQKNSRSLKIAMVVPGRFHAFDLTLALLNRHHQVTLFTNYPKWAVRKFGVPGQHVRSFWLHGVVARLFGELHKLGLPTPEKALTYWFSRWATSQIQRERWDVIHSWSGFSEEVWALPNQSGTLKLLMRGSSHIQTQSQILEQEKKRSKKQFRAPKNWRIKRETREYAGADKIRVLSGFAQKSFIDQGISSDKVWVLPLGTPVESFKPKPGIIEARRQRISSGKPLRVLYVGSITLRKGVYDIAKITHALKGKPFQFRLVGAIASEAKSFCQAMADSVEFISNQPQNRLPHWYAWADLFIFPTLEDGFAYVLAQAKASGLPILATTNCAGPDLIEEAKTGWILPIASPDLFVKRLLWCNEHRNELTEMIQRVTQSAHFANWDVAAKNFEDRCLEWLSKSPASQSPA